MVSTKVDLKTQPKVGLCATYICLDHFVHSLIHLSSFEKYLKLWALAYALGEVGLTS
jgi:hypothetical protein